MTAKRAAFGLVLGASMVLAGCGNETDKGIGRKAVLGALTGGAKAPAAATPEQIAAAVQGTLATVDLPLALVMMQKSGTAGILVHIETNGTYETWGTSDRKTMVMKNGIVTATRGLGNDLMSSDTGQAGALVSARESGSGGRVLRFIDGENHTVELRAACQVRAGAQSRFTSAEIVGVAVTAMEESCTVDGQTIRNSYLVDARGQALQSRQWLGDAIGYAVIQRLR